MATTTIVITDTADGRSIKTHCDYQPKHGEPCTLAQAATLEILARTRREYGLPQPEQTPEVVASMPACPKCGSNSQVWINQITQRLTCHRVQCHTAKKDQA